MASGCMWIEKPRGGTRMFVIGTLVSTLSASYSQPIAELVASIPMARFHRRERERIMGNNFIAIGDSGANK